jgi:hypothetical protein
MAHCPEATIIFLTREVGCSAASWQHRWLGLVRVSG